MQSIKSRALEPTRVELAAMSRKSALLSMLPVYGLPILGLCLFIFFSLILPTTFPTLFNFRSLLSDKAIVAVLALASMVPMMVGRIDLTVGYGLCCGTFWLSVCKRSTACLGRSASSSFWRAVFASALRTASWSRSPG